MASKLSGVGVHTIRAWEKRYKALEPLRDASGHRTYTKSDVEKLMLLSELCLLGYTISKVAKLSIKELKDLLLDLGKSQESVDITDFNLLKEKVSVEAKQSLPILLFALKSYKMDVINQELSKIKFDSSPRELALDVILPLTAELIEIQSHGNFASSQVQTFLQLLAFHANSVIYRSLDKPDKARANVIVANLDSDHEIDLLASCLILQHYEFNFTFLGSNISYESLNDSIGFLSPSILLIKAHQMIIEKIASHFPQLEIIWFTDSKVALGGQFKKVIKISSLREFDESLTKKVL